MTFAAMVRSLSPQRRALRTYVPASADSSIHWGRLVLIGIGVTGLGTVAGAAVAAPRELLVIGKFLSTSLLEAARGGFAEAQPMLLAVVDGVGLSSPRQLGMAAAGAVLLTAAASAAYLSVRGSSTSGARAGASGSRASSRGASPVLANSLDAETPTRRWRPSSTRTSATPQHVASMAAGGSTPLEIARRTGLPVDAVALLLSRSDSSRQLQPQ